MALKTFIYMKTNKKISKKYIPIKEYTPYKKLFYFIILFKK